MEPIYHITQQSAWNAAAGAAAYRGDILDREGFIHCSTRDQVGATANRYFRGAHGLALLEIDPEKLAVPLRYERAPEGGLFPHVYGPINREAVRQVLAFEPGPDGEFAFPEADSAEAKIDGQAAPDRMKRQRT